MQKLCEVKAKFNHIGKDLAIFASLAFLISGLPVVAGEIKSVPLGQEVYLHNPNQKPVHLGDGEGNVSDIPKEFFGPQGTKYTLGFSLDYLPTSAILEIAAFSVTTEFPCDDNVYVNGKKRYDWNYNLSSTSLWFWKTV